MAIDIFAGEDLTSWALATSAAVSLGAFTYYSLRILSSDRAVLHVQREYSVALRSALLYVTMAAPPFLLQCEGGGTWSSCTKSPHWFIPTNLMRSYHWLPFWYSCFVTVHLGDFLASVRQGTCGVAIGLIAIAAFNALMPGGAGLPAYDPADVQGGLFPGGYNELFVLMVSPVFVYVVFASSLGHGTKQYALGMFSAMIVPFMNPKTQTGFRAIFMDKDFKVHWKGMAMCEAWLIVISMVFGALSQGVLPWSRSSLERRTCMRTASQGLEQLAEDTGGCLEWLLAMFCHSGHSYEIEKSFFYIRNLGARRTELEAVLSNAESECKVLGSSGQLEALSDSMDLMRRLRQALRVGRDHVQSFGRLHREHRSDTVQDSLEDFVVACKDALSVVTRSVSEPGGFSAKARKEASEAADRADRCISEALLKLSEHCGTTPKGMVRTLMQLGQGETNGISHNVSAEMAFIDQLRTWPLAIRRCTGKQEEVALQRTPSSSVDQESTAWGSPHAMAVRCTATWFLALLFGVYWRGYSSGCVVGVSFMFSTSMGTSFDKNINRMVGVGLGLAAGNIPAMLVMRNEASATSPLHIFAYLIIMLVMWTAACYGYLATGSTYSFACLIWTGFAGVQMLKHIPTFGSTLSRSPCQGLFMDVIDNFLACLLIFLVDLMYAHAMGTSTSVQVKDAVVECMEQAAKIADCVTSESFSTACVGRLAENIKVARHWHQQMRQDGMIWTTLWEPAYRADLVSALLTHCDQVYVAAYGIESSAQRCRGGMASALVLTRQLLPEGFSEKCSGHVQLARALLDGDAEALRALVASETASESAASRQESTDEQHLSPRWARKQAAMLEMDQMTGGAEGASGVTAAAATAAVRHEAISLQEALQHIGALLAAEAALTFKDWRTLARHLDSASVEKKASLKWS